MCQYYSIAGYLIMLVIIALVWGWLTDWFRDWFIKGYWSNKIDYYFNVLMGFLFAIPLLFALLIIYFKCKG